MSREMTTWPDAVAELGAGVAPPTAESTNGRHALPPRLVRRTTPRVRRDPFRLGYRELLLSRPDGTPFVKRVPLQWHDLLHPREGDVIVETYPHERDRTYLTYAFRHCAEAIAGWMVFSDLRIEWKHFFRAHAPDISIFADVFNTEGLWGTFSESLRRARPVLVLEIVSPDDRRVRDNDLIHKRLHYQMAGVPLYLIVDREPGDLRPRLLGYELVNGEYQALQMTADGKLPIGPLGLLLGAKSDRVALYDAATGEEVGDYDAIVSQAEAEKRARKEAEALLAAEVVAREAAEATAKAEAEARAAEVAARQVAEAAMRSEAEARLRAEAQALAAEREAQSVKRQLEELMRRLQLAGQNPGDLPP